MSEFKKIDGVEEFLRERREEVADEERYDEECRRLYGRKEMTREEVMQNLEERVQRILQAQALRRATKQNVVQEQDKAA